ncbi:alpha-1,2-fucosyltransferase [Mucilaginibacter sp. L196]|uniref:alpha-1,2-fucosyltransferase n=1 Tax=Mucilaginibacter sp. L196 TaxID=1641870 RepID=UPI00131E2084|nr:alpha-1,2-fucosyltransferase [Mucilaginibacter sp. L196]
MLIVSKLNGQLGNKLFHFSYFIANAIEHEHKLVYPGFSEYKEYFEKTALNDFGRYNVTQKILPGGIFNKRLSILLQYHKIKYYKFAYHSLQDEDYQNIDFDLNNINFQELIKNKILIADGWQYRDRDNLVKHKETIRSIFTPQKKYLDKVEKLITDLRQAADVVIGVHIRRGDYASFNNGKYFYPVEVYTEKMKEIKSLFEQQGKTCAFLICSNESFNKDIFNNMKVNIEERHFITDIYALSKCDYIIGPPSTFSLWASFYGSVPLMMIETPDMKVELDKFSIANN